MSRSEFCPYTKICHFYEKWAKQNKDEKLENVVIDYIFSYDCKVKEKLQDQNPCSYITLLNKINDIWSRI
jgi:hypothetical protein